MNGVKSLKIYIKNWTNCQPKPPIILNPKPPKKAILKMENGKPIKTTLGNAKPVNHLYTTSETPSTQT